MSSLVVGIARYNNLCFTPKKICWHTPDRESLSTLSVLQALESLKGFFPNTLCVFASRGHPEHHNFLILSSNYYAM